MWWCEFEAGIWIQSDKNDTKVPVSSSFWTWDSGVSAQGQMGGHRWPTPVGVRGEGLRASGAGWEEARAFLPLPQLPGSNSSHGWGPVSANITSTSGLKNKRWTKSLCLTQDLSILLGPTSSLKVKKKSYLYEIPHIFPIDWNDTGEARRLTHMLTHTRAQAQFFWYAFLIFCGLSSVLCVHHATFSRLVCQNSLSLSVHHNCWVWKQPGWFLSIL